MAESIARAKFGDTFEPLSAGFRPQDPSDAANAIYTLRSIFNIDASGHVPRDVRELDVDDFDLVVCMDKRVGDDFAKAFSAFPVKQRTVWKIADPFGDDLEEYSRCARAIFRELSRLDREVTVRPPNGLG
jgi:protein-tyrosine-phosphatase